MRFAPDKDFSSYTIRSYEAGQVNLIVPVSEEDDRAGEINELALTRSFVVSPKQLIKDWAPQNISELTAEDLNVVMDLNPELVLLGTGKRIEFPSPALTEALYNKGIGVEIMDTAAACRTYNVLMYEEREVVAALMLD
jgi:uncharacterized protein